MPGPRHLYLHVPFCRSRCAYCAFYSTTAATPVLLDRYCKALLAEASEAAGDGPLETVYFGGGTPSLLGVDRIAGLLEGLRAGVPFTQDAEVTLEDNPEGLAPGDAAGYRDAGVTRLSLGVQSFDDADLHLLGRPHDGATARRAVAGALDAGLRTSLDLIYGLPGRSGEQWCAQLDAAAETGVEHLSAYELSVEPGTPFAARWPGGLGDRAALFFDTHEHLATLGFEGYEVSSFARSPEHRSRHNLATWEHRFYRGLGPGAHSFLPGTDGPMRRWNLPDLRGWLETLEAGATPPRGQEILDGEQRLLERVMLGVRTRRGVDLGALRRECGDAATDALIQRATNPTEAGLLVLEADRLRPTLEGMALADRLAIELTT
jgi:oxygen-independent coproporphyrinogen-3 oxidase